MYLHFRTGSIIACCMVCKVEMQRSNIKFPLFFFCFVSVCLFFGSSAMLPILQLLEVPTGAADSTRDKLLVLCYAGLWFEHNKRFVVNMCHLCAYPECCFYGADGLQALYAAPCR